LSVPGDGRATLAIRLSAVSAAAQLTCVLAPSALSCCPPAWHSAGGMQGGEPRGWGQANRFQQESVEEGVVVLME